MTKIQAMICIYNLSSSLTQEDKQALQIILDEIVVLNDRLGSLDDTYNLLLNNRCVK